MTGIGHCKYLACLDNYRKQNFDRNDLFFRIPHSKAIETLNNIGTILCNFEDFVKDICLQIRPRLLRSFRPLTLEVGNSFEKILGFNSGYYYTNHIGVNVLFT